MKTKNEVKDEHKNETTISVKINPERIAEIEIPPTISRLKKRHLVYINKRICDLGGGKKMPALISISGFVLLSKGAKKYRGSESYAKYRLANAFLVDTFSKQMLYGFYIESYNSAVPVDSFPRKGKAFRWLKTFKQ